MKFPVRRLFGPVIIFLLCYVSSCKKETFTSSSSALLRTSADTLHFDTVFTSVGSVSQVVKIINDNKKGIHVSSVRLAGGSSSPFKINVDGISGPQINTVDVNGNDSTYIFVTVAINPDASNLPFIVRDSIEIVYNGNRKFIQLDAYGQNAHFFRNRVIKTSETWNNDLPYVLSGRLTVDTNALLTINKGCHIYIHADAPFIVNGSLQVNGEKYDSTRVVFTGDRMDDPYRDYPASYPGLFFTDVSTNSNITYGIIKNAYQGVVSTGPAASGTKITLNETIIDNAYDAGLLGINTSLNARNLLISNCGKNIILARGGNYTFTHCTASTYSNSFIQHKDPVLLITNFVIENGSIINGDLNAVFRNCIFWAENNGLVDNEVVVSKNGNSIFNVSFDHVLWRVQGNPGNANIVSSITNPPQFDSINVGQHYYNFRLKDSSPAINAGINSGVSSDLDGKPRPVGLPDLGCYEKQ